jgi:hypothetical protein
MIIRNYKDLKAWSLLLNFCNTILAKPSKSGQNDSLASIIKTRINNYITFFDVKEDNSVRKNKIRSEYSEEQLSRVITSKIEDGNIRAALRILLSDDKPAENNNETFSKLLERHPSVNSNRATVTDATPENALQVTESDVFKAINSFPNGSSGSLDGLRPQHIMNILNNKDTKPALLSAITAFVNLLLQGHCAPDIIPILFGGSLTALAKKSGGIRPIAVGYYWRRLAAKCANNFATSKLSEYFAPIQLGVGIRGGCEAAVHACRRYLENIPDNHVIAKLDFSNAFNSLHRDAMLNAISTHVPEIYAFCHLAYSTSSILKFGNHTIYSQEGCQQGDPLGPLIFCLTIHPILQSLNSNFKIGYLDDITIAGPELVVANDVSFIKNNGAIIGLHLNTDKCELVSTTVSTVSPIDNFVHIDIDKATLLGAPLTPGVSMDYALNKKLNEMNRAADRLRLITSHDALVLLKASCSAPKIMHLLRSSPCSGHSLLNDIDFVLRKCLSNITNVDINNDQWEQASLPVRNGGLGVRSVSAIASSAFLASTSSTWQLQNQLLINSQLPANDLHFDRLKEEWINKHPSIQPPSGNVSHKQRSWDEPSVVITYNKLLASQPDNYGRARILAAANAHSGDWLNTLPISSCGLRLDDEAIRVAVGLRLGASLCESHLCPCGAQVDCRGSHCLSCKMNSGRIARHNYLNDIIYHALVKAGVPSTKEPAGLSRTDGKRPDGLTLVPWLAGKNAVWDVTVSDTLASSYLSATSVTAGSAAELACTRKEHKYSELSNNYLFIPLAFESLGSVASKTLIFLRDLGRRLTGASEDSRETAFLFQRLSIAIQRFNAVCFRGCFNSELE